MPKTMTKTKKIAKKKPTRFRFRNVEGGKQRLGFVDSKVVEVKTIKESNENQSQEMLERKERRIFRDVSEPSEERKALKRELLELKLEELEDVRKKLRIRKDGDFKVRLVREGKKSSTINISSENNPQGVDITARKDKPSILTDRKTGERRVSQTMVQPKTLVSSFKKLPHVNRDDLMPSRRTVVKKAPQTPKAIKRLRMLINRMKKFS